MASTNSVDGGKASSDEDPTLAPRRRLWAAKRAALEARQDRERAELDMQQLLERAEEATHRESETQQAQDRARRKHAALAARLKSAEETLRLAETQHGSAADAAHRLSRIAAEASERQARAQQAEEEALAEVARIDLEVRQAEGEPEPPPAPPEEAVVTDPEKAPRPAPPLLTSLLIGGLAVAVVTAWALGGPSGADREPVERPGVRANEETTTGAVVPDAEGLSALDARRSLAAAGLSVAEVVPTVGTPGEVVRSVPAAGSEVTQGTPVTLYIGVEANRYQQETSPLTSG